MLSDFGQDDENRLLALLQLACESELRCHADE